MTVISTEAMGRSDDLPGRAVFEARFTGGGVPRPPHRSACRVRAGRGECWRGAESRLHERTLCGVRAGAWRESLLRP